MQRAGVRAEHQDLGRFQERGFYWEYWLAEWKDLHGHDHDRSGAEALDALHHYLEVARWAPGDHVIVAAHAGIIGEVGFDRPVPCNLHATSGTDAADVMLLAHAPAELVARRYGCLVIGSGDHIFVQRAKAVRELGVGVLVVARPDACCRGFRRAGFPVAAFEPAVGVTPEPALVAA